MKVFCTYRVSQKIKKKFNILPVGDTYTMSVAKIFKIKKELRLF